MKIALIITACLIGIALLVFLVRSRIAPTYSVSASEINTTRRSFFRIVPWPLTVIVLYLVYGDYHRRATQEKIAQERAMEDQAVSEIRKLGGYTRSGGPPEFRVTSVEFIATGEVINGKAVIDELKITDDGLVHLKALTHLQTLNLGSTKVTDVGLEHLKGLSSLETLNIRNTQVTDKGVKTLQDALPNCKIAR